MAVADNRKWGNLTSTPASLACILSLSPHLHLPHSINTSIYLSYLLHSSLSPCLATHLATALFLGPPRNKDATEIVASRIALFHPVSFRQICGQGP